MVHTEQNNSNNNDDDDDDKDEEGGVGREEEKKEGERKGETRKLEKKSIVFSLCWNQWIIEYTNA